MRVNGLFGWVRHNNVRSTAILLSFALLSQPMAMVVLFAPLVFLDPAHAPWYNWAGYGARYAPGVALAAVGYFLFQMWRHVNAVRRDVAFCFVDHGDEPRLCGLIEPLAIASGIDAPHVGVIESPAMNAFACGVTRNLSVLVFTRGLINGLDDDELSAVIAHELIHIGNGDTRLIAAANVFMRTLGLLNRANIFKPKRYRQIAILLFAPILFPVYLGVALLAQLCVRLGYASRLMISSAREFIADAEAIRLTQDPAALVSALRGIEGDWTIAGLAPEQDAMMIAGAAQGVLATHPPIAERIEAIVAMTGAIALDSRPRRDTRSDLQRTRSAWRNGVSGGEAGGPNEARKLLRIAVTSAAPRQSGLKAFLRVGDGGELSVFGLRWDMATAMLATFVAAGLMHHGDMLGFVGRMGHALDRPDGHTQSIIDKALACRSAQFMQLIGRPDANATQEACGFTSDFIAGATGRHVLGDGSMVTDSQLMMLSPAWVQRVNARPFDSSRVFKTPSPRPAAGTAPPPDTSPPPIDLPPSYPLPLHEAWLRLAGDDLRHYLRDHQCGVLIHAHVSTEQDRSITWSITSEGEERIRFTATLEPIGVNATRVTLAIDDRQPRFKLYDGANKDKPPELVVFRPALSAPLRPHFVEEISAALEDRLFEVKGLFSQASFLPGDGMTGGLCMDQRQRLEMNFEHFSIHDPVRFH